MSIHVQVDLGLGDDAAAEELDEATRALARELSELDVEVARLSAGPPPPGARAVEVAALGSLALKLGGKAVGPLVAALQGWLSRRSGRTIKMTLGADSIEISGGSDAYQRQMLETFLAARAG